MGDNKRGNGFAKRQLQRNDTGPLTAKPFKETFKGVKVGPDCLKCGRTVDARLGSSLVQPKGARNSQRQGYLHEDCLRENTEERKKKGVTTLMVIPLDEEDIEEYLASRGISQ
jgi:hypothetical protein